ncbi:MAG: hypothetical protein HZA25_01700 [Candidatus Niyogibacteria bacterium]|nr:hypothetical protein [Candidatus Niyogibacteria bacterium]
MKMRPIVIMMAIILLYFGDGAALTLKEKAQEYDRIASERHLLPPQNLIVSVRLAEEKISGCEDLGDAPIWTAYYLAAQSYRYAATNDPEALANARRALSGIKALFAVTGERGLMARYYFPDGVSKYREDIFPCANGGPQCVFFWTTSAAISTSA